MRGNTKSVVVAAVMGMLVALPADASAHARTWKDVQVSDIETMGQKFVGLARAFDEADYDWRPMEGVRSVREVLALAVAEAHLFPGLWGGTPPAGAAQGFGPEMERVAPMSRTAMIAELESSFAFFASNVRSMSDQQRMAEGAFFGTAMPNHAVIASALGDMHEHLGQLIAYARVNRVVPPWSS